MTTPQKPVLVLVVCAAPPASDIGQLADQLMQRGWEVHIVATEAAVEWIDVEHLEALTSKPVRTRLRGLQEPKAPEAATVVVAPATFNTINLWAAGINNTAALGVLNGALGAGTPIVASPYAKRTLASHPAFDRSLRTLAEAGVRLTATDALRPASDTEPFAWACVLDQLNDLSLGS